jgi:hypothetical protein
MTKVTEEMKRMATSAILNEHYKINREPSEFSFTYTKEIHEFLCAERLAIAALEAVFEMVEKEIKKTIDSQVLASKPEGFNSPQLEKDEEGWIEYSRYTIINPPLGAKLELKCSSGRTFTITCSDFYCFVEQSSLMHEITHYRIIQDKKESVDCHHPDVESFKNGIRMCLICNHYWIDKEYTHNDLYRKKEPVKESVDPGLYAIGSAILNSFTKKKPYYKTSMSLKQPPCPDCGETPCSLKAALYKGEDL